MAKKKGKQSGRRGPEEGQAIGRVKLPNKQMGEIFARVVEIYGNDRMGVFCQDGTHKIGRIRGKIKKRVWIRRGDLVVVNPWDFDPDKCEITWRYTSAEISWLERKNIIPEILDVNNITF
jgi:translation initiation factor 1A